MIEIRQATDRDEAALYEILDDAVRHKQEHGDQSWQPGFSRDGVKWLIGLGTTYLVAVDGQPAGTFGLPWEDHQDKEAWEGFDTSEAGYVHRMAVSGRFRGQELGKHILDWADGQVRERGRKYLRLDCNPENKGLCAYYEGLGFVRMGTHHFEPRADLPAYTAALYQRAAKDD